MDATVEPDSDVAELVREFLASTGVSKAELARRAGVSDSTLSNVLRGIAGEESEEKIRRGIRDWVLEVTSYLEDHRNLLDDPDVAESVRGLTTRTRARQGRTSH